MTIDELKNDYDWQIIFGEPPTWSEGERDRGYGVDGATRDPSNPITREVRRIHYALSDIKSIVATANGENDERNWIGLFEMNDGAFLFVEAGCDYTGWDCRSNGSSEWFNTREEAVACISAEARERLGLA